MSPAAAAAPLPTKSEIQDWDTSYLDTAATSWRQAATASEDAFDQHRQNVDAPGGTTWTGAAKDAALDRVTNDIGVVGRQSGVLREAATIAENGAFDIKSAKDKAVEAITAAVDDGFTVGEDLSVTDSREYDIDTAAERNRAAAEHAEDIRWAAQQLVQADQLVGNRLEAKAADLEGIRFEGEGEGEGDQRGGNGAHIDLVDNKVKYDSEGKDQAGEKKPEVPAQAPGQIGPFAVPKSVEDAAKKDGLKPDEKPVTTGDVGGDLGDLLGTNDPATAGAEPKPATAAQISPQQVEQFKTQARNLLRQQGVPAEQIESRVNAMVADAQRANTTLADSAAHTPAKPETTPGPAPADTRSWGEKLGDKFNNFVNEAHDQFYNRIDSTVETLQNLTGLGGEGHPGVRESWQQLGEAALQQQKDDPLHLRSPIGPLGPWGAVNDVIHDIPEMIDNPGKYAGDKAFDATAMAVTMPLGGEGALGRALFPELGALERSALPGAGHTLEHAAPPAVPHTPDSSPVVPHTPDSSPVVPHTPDPPAAPHTAEPPAAPRTAEASPVPHSAEPVVPHSAEPPPVPHSAEPPPVEHHHPSADASPEHHAPDPDHADFTPPPIEHHDAGGGSTYKERIDQTPINNGHWMGERGESKWISQNPDVNRFLDEANVDGIHYSNGQPDFSPVAKGQVEIPDMTTNRDYNFKVADKLLAQEWGVSPRDIAEWRSDNKYTWHEEPDLKTMQLVPSIVNNRLGHVGGIGELNAGKTLPPPIGEGGP
ncbi:HNH endonuclease [Mycobacteroides abscessus]|uniref:HNH endonuclease n=1 Tax=Mycobacteroides abscessus TaxID=36809 RepID=UPI0007F97653|nr:HNH endonuclease [Mycobacteroides abscessus]ANO08092.1 hypothetical protein BAB76_04105 [Mycobacteroides abscessus]MDM3921156.1 HNH endonuclease [Mycobacteroides abscessus]MDO2965003.1 HNH endonuclease [Mycobacteroides abscessus subsp. abscessus]MDO3260276.1 HNH endonuclease [Mycobacteroides abscessus subsp. abscessus]MDO3309754.1 HNH endonuclease [Mycobacteroides abscessus subsp. abscessus]